MLVHHHKSICLTLISTDLPIWSVVRADATLYQKEADQFHLLLTEPKILDRSLQEQVYQAEGEQGYTAPLQTTDTPRLLWLEISPYRVIMTMQGNGKFSYRHFWERGIYGFSRYWLQSDSTTGNGQLRLRNFTRGLSLQRDTLPQSLRVEYELWSEKVQLGCYVLSLEIHH